MNASSQRGSAILMLFIAVALFGMIAYAFLQGSRGNISMLTNEASKATGYQTTDCSNAVNMATKRLTARGCGSLISSATDGSNANPGAPTDGSCSIYHPNGGGVKNCSIPTAPSDPCLTGPIGTLCSDNAIYVGILGGNRLYMATADEGFAIWKTTSTNTAGTNGTTDGLVNTNAMVAAGIANHPAAQFCVNKSPSGTWYLPASSEFVLVWTNSTANGGALNFNTAGILGVWSFWTSTQTGGTNATVYYPTANFATNGLKGSLSSRVRCFRR